MRRLHDRLTGEHARRDRREPSVAAEGVTAPSGTLLALVYPADAEHNTRQPLESTLLRRLLCDQRDMASS